MAHCAEEEVNEGAVEEAVRMTVDAGLVAEESFVGDQAEVQIDCAVGRADRSFLLAIVAVKAVGDSSIASAVFGLAAGIESGSKDCSLGSEHLLLAVGVRRFHSAGRGTLLGSGYSHIDSAHVLDSGQVE